MIWLSMRSQILADAFGRVRELVIDLTDGLTDEIATYRPDPEANSISWLPLRRVGGALPDPSARCRRYGGTAAA